MELEKKVALQNYRALTEQQTKATEAITDLRTKLADAECRQTKTEIQNKDLQSLATENGSVKQQSESRNQTTDGGTGGKIACLGVTGGGGRAADGRQGRG